MAMAMPKQHSQSPQPKKVPVVYYLCRNRHLEHPHFMEVPLSSSSEALYLRDVIIRLNALRGKGMAAMYSWSCKRSYKNGFVWHDLSEDDLVHPRRAMSTFSKVPNCWIDPARYSTNCLDFIDNTMAQATPDREFKTTATGIPTSCRNQEVCSSSSSPTILVEGTKLPHHHHCHRRLLLHHHHLLPLFEKMSHATLLAPVLLETSLPNPKEELPPHQESSLSPTEYRIYKPVGAQDASTQTDDRKGKNPVQAETRTTGVSTDDGPLDFQERDPKRTPRSNEQPEMIIESSPPLTSSSVSSVGE
uniref:SOSEKI DIX-like domain-containing protein n=1 Tax=Ananas comosus var. bracteatus TaxID=296719 RepID=A0A6V7PIW9_ANACO|nr:unnamed protein product [Ananas comosus var. bracteatus]